jgi:hypothetical protein
MLFLIFQLVFAEINQFSFRSPFLPEHSEKFRTVGDAIPLRKFVRLGPPRQNSTGGLISSEAINLTSFEIQTVINSAGDSPNENIGLSLWLSSKPEPLGRLYGLSSSFRGLALFIDVAKHRLYSNEILEDLTIEKVLSSENCPIEVKNRQTSIHVHFTGQTFEVWIKDRRMRKCTSVTPTQVPTSHHGDLFFGISSFSGNNTSTVFDVLEIITADMEDEDNENEAIKQLEESLTNELKIIEDHLGVMEHRIK